ncbi:MAG TPA: thiolase domain-containing protein, partial [Nitrospiria bacterium]|nr:thiolase domain-containing protein [Nitrospiria bacterium]
VILLPHESEAEYKDLKYPGVHSFRGGRTAARLAYKMAGIKNPIEEIDFIELHDAYTSSEIQTYEDLGLCKYGEGGRFVESGKPFMPGIDYELKLKDQGKIPVNPSGGLLACGHPVGATGLMQAVFAFWQLQGSIKRHLGSDMLQIADAKKGLIHSHAGTGTYITVSVLESC